MFIIWSVECQCEIQLNLDIGMPHYGRFHTLYFIIQVFCLSFIGQMFFFNYRKGKSEWNKNIQKYSDFEIILYESIPIVVFPSFMNT
jgi:hypothetical protein